MRHTIKMTFLVIALSVGVVLQSGTASAQMAGPSLDEQLKAQYKAVKMGTDSGGTAVIEPGTVLVIQRGGILGVKPTSWALCPSKFQDGELHAPGGFCAAMIKGDSRYFQKGEKVYPTKIDVNLDKDRVTFLIVDCDACNGVNPPAFYKSQVIFQFAKGELRNKSVPQVEDTIAQVLAIDQGEEASQQVQSSSTPISQPVTQAPTQPQTISLGETTDQVVAILGQPEKIVNLGSKQIYVYRDLKVTFVNGTVSDVQ